jgi:cytochrome P450
MLAAAVAPIRAPIPGTLMAGGVKGRAFMVEHLGREVESRRASEGEDLFTELCRARTEDGRLLSSQEIIDHMSLAIGNPPWPY